MKTPEQNETTSSKCILVLVCGIPAVGKTTLCQQLAIHLNNSNNNDDDDHNIICRSFHVCFDQMYTYTHNHDDDDDDVDNQSSSTTTTLFNPTQWKLKQLEMAQQVRHLIHNAKINQTTIILVDDNFYYSSMRHVYYTMARDYHTAFCILFLKSNDVNMCLRRNLQREGNNQVPESVIHNMYHKFEYKVPYSSSSVVQTLTIDVDNLSESFNLESISNFILQCSCFSNDVDNHQSREQQVIEQRELSRRANQQLLHKLDLVLRKRIRSIITTLMNDHTFESKRNQIALVCNEQKKKLFEGVKNGEFEWLLKRDVSDVDDNDEFIISHLEQILDFNIHKVLLLST